MYSSNRKELREVVAAIVPPAQAKQPWLAQLLEYLEAKAAEYDQTEEVLDRSFDSSCYVLRKLGVARGPKFEGSHGRVVIGEQALDMADHYRKTMTAIHNQILSLNRYIEQRSHTNYVEVHGGEAAQ